MSVQPGDEWSDDTGLLDDEPPFPRPEPSGDARVDAVIEAVAGLDDRPLEEHVAVLEAAHGELRRALDTA
ncbi:hypothetical protein FE634_11685 [Nocardioides dongxiaopingii]|uniref:hypothetical protein n=1 Tax=Nocardioides sp. S-1144 TaxID=2582905 RepID=UPI00110DD4FE|nr:hypothetical protein [Nocardioides sp. S-1144]QCW50897.1 hypothetical protein FE634_11685 [Nocardioides sp. S-1144]